MQLLTSILSEIFVIEVEVSHSAVSMKMNQAVYSFRNSGIILREIDNEQFSLWKKKPGIAILIISGNDIGSKDCGTSVNDETVRKITDNENLLWTVHEENDSHTIDFIRKSSLDSILNEIARKNLYIADITVSQRADIDIHTKLQQVYEKKLNFDLVKKSKEFREFFFDSLFEKIKLPLLLLFFLLLFINYVVYSNIREKYEFRETAYNIQLQKNKQDIENREKASRLFGEYNKIQSYPLALISDRIASYIPRDVWLTSMVFFPENRSRASGQVENDSRSVIIVKGKAEIAGTVLLFAQYLQEDKLFSKIDILNINNLKDGGLYDFEIHIIL